MFPETQQQRWMAQWRAAGAALRAQRASELAALSDEQALAAAAALLQGHDRRPDGPGTPPRRSAHT